MYPTTVLTPQQRADIHTQARRQAQLLRRAAVADFWRSAYDAATRALRAARASAKPHTMRAPSGTASRNPSGV